MGSPWACPRINSGLPMVLSLNKAAKEGNVSRATLHRALKDGEFSATKDDKGRWSIDESEFGRWLTSRSVGLPGQAHENNYGLAHGPPSGLPLKTDQNSEPEIEKRDFMIERLKLEIEKLEAERDDWKGQAKMLLLNPPSPRSRRSQGIKGFLQRVWGSSGREGDEGS